MSTVPCVPGQRTRAFWSPFSSGSLLFGPLTRTPPVIFQVRHVCESLMDLSSSTCFPGLLHSHASRAPPPEAFPGSSSHSIPSLPPIQVPMCLTLRVMFDPLWGPYALVVDLGNINSRQHFILKQLEQSGRPQHTQKELGTLVNCYVLETCTRFDFHLKLWPP